MSDRLDLSELTKFITFMRKTIDRFDEKVALRDSPLNFPKMLYCISSKIGLGYSYEKIRTQLKIYGIADVERQAICERRKDIPSSYIKEVNDELYRYIRENINGRRYVAFDGSKINVPLKTGYYRMNKFGTYRTAMIGSIYDIINHVVINYTISKSYNEREILKSQLDYLSTGDVLIGDRGYFGKDVIWNCVNRNLDFVLRLQGSLGLVKNFIKTGKDDAIVDYKLSKLVTIKVRMVKYIIDKEIYYIATSLTNNDEYSFVGIQNIYKMRWDIETDFRYSKSVLSLGNLMSQSRNFIEQDVYMHQFIGIIECAIRLTCFDSQDGKYKMNTSNCYTIIVNHLLRQILWKRQTKKTKKKVKRCIETIIESKTEIIKNRHYKREAKRPKTHMLSDYRIAKKERAIKKAKQKPKKKLTVKQKQKKKSKKDIIRMRKQHKRTRRLIMEINNYANNGYNYIVVVNVIANSFG